MRCTIVQDQFSEIYDGIAPRQAALVRHIKKCPDCTAKYESYKQMLDDVRKLPAPELPEGFHESIMDKIIAIAPPNDHAIDTLLSEIEARKRNKESRARMQSMQKGRAASRWAGIAAAACLAFASMWALQTLDMLPTTRGDYAPLYALPQAVAADMAAEADDFAADDIAAESESAPPPEPVTAVPAAEAMDIPHANESRLWGYSQYGYAEYDQEYVDFYSWGSGGAGVRADAAPPYDTDTEYNRQAQDTPADIAVFDALLDNDYTDDIYNEAEEQLPTNRHLPPPDGAVAQPQEFHLSLTGGQGSNWAIVIVAATLGLGLAIVSIALNIRNKNARKG